MSGRSGQRHTHFIVRDLDVISTDLKVLRRGGANGDDDGANGANGANGGDGATSRTTTAAAATATTTTLLVTLRVSEDGLATADDQEGAGRDGGVTGVAVACVNLTCAVELPDTNVTLRLVTDLNDGDVPRAGLNASAPEPYGAASSSPRRQLRCVGCTI